MVRLIARLFPALLAVGTLAAFVPTTTLAQAPKRNEIRIPALVTGEEMTAQHNIWALEVYMKPMRLIAVDLTDPKTGEKKLEYVWYITYRAVHRTALDRTEPNTPENQFDAPVSPPLFIPEFTMLLTDNDRTEVLPDQVIPEALVAINKREKTNYKSSVAVVGPLPEATAPGSGTETALMGVAMWRAVDPDADRYTVYMTGFSNGIRKVNGPDGEPIIQTKTIKTKYIRRGDRFEQNEGEIQLDGEPEWIYR